ncbi:hypothetical protein [Acetobacterium sp. KB-1]|uniref:hypothetical protein n=1 Tax=Acetobacterium sp. KB-1 TaxID=2184575 RepID=UPI00195516E9|nr:hypothetical protein [Acetobacterium sp. KB-1]
MYTIYFLMLQFSANLIGYFGGTISVFTSSPSFHYFKLKDLEKNITTRSRYQTLK